MKQTLLFITVLICAVITGTAWWFWQDMQRNLYGPVNIKNPVLFNIEPGMSLQSIADKLENEGIINQPHYLIIEARRQGRAERLKAGEYRIEPGMTPAGLLDYFIAGDVVQYALALIEGWRAADVLNTVKQNPHLVQTLVEPDVDTIMSAIQVEELSAEGQFFPDTYHFPRGTTDIEFLRRAYLRMQNVLAQEWERRSDDLPYQTPYDALIMASIIEKETGIPEERAEIAGVFVRRLVKGMKLQTDPTVIYAMQENFDGNIRRKDLKIDSPYNTYVYPGLPPTPIALVGRDALHAALHPADGNTLYFVAKGDGSHHFSETLDEHNRAVGRYQLGKNGD